jgi:predicted MFS family arabinose efflux permease
LKNTTLFQAIIFAAIRTVVNTMHRMAYPFLAVFSRGLGVDLATLSRVLATRSLMGMVGPFFATIGDSRGRKLGMLLGLGLFTLGTSVVVFWPTFPAFAAALILAALGKIIFDPPMQAYMGDRVPYERRGRVLAVTELGWSLAFIVGIPLMGFLIARWGWMSPFWILTTLGLLAIFLLNWMVPADNMQRGAAPNVFTNIRKVLTYHPALAGLAIGLFCSAANEVINLVFGIWMEDSFGLQIAALGATAAVVGFAELSGESMVGVFADRLGKPKAIAFGLLGNCLAALAFPSLGQTLPGAVVGLFLFYLTFEFTLVSTIPMMTEIMPHARATMMAINISAMSLGRALGALVAPALFSWGMGTSAGAAVVFNLLALLALRWVRTQERSASSAKPTSLV